MDRDLNNGKDPLIDTEGRAGQWWCGCVGGSSTGPFVQTCPTKRGWANQQPATKRGMERFLEALIDLTRGNVNKSKSQWDNSFQH